MQRTNIYVVLGDLKRERERTLMEVVVVEPVGQLFFSLEWPDRML